MEMYFWPITTTTPSKRKCVPPQHTQKPLISVFCLLCIAASAAFFSFNRSMKRENAKWNTLMDTRGARRLIFSKWRYLSQNEQQKPPTKSSRIQEEMLCLCYLKKNCPECFKKNRVRFVVFSCLSLEQKTAFGKQFAFVLASLLLSPVHACVFVLGSSF